jgi:uncharacterized repeat protein (TIGR01451 family)
MSDYDDDQIEFDFFDEPETVEATQRRRLPRLDRGDRGGGDDGTRPPKPPRGSRGVSPGLVPLARLAGLIAIGIVVVLVLVLWVGSCQGKSKHDAYASYAQKVHGIQAADKALGTKFATTLNSTLKQSDLETSLAGYAQQEQQELTQAQQILAPGPLRATHQRLLDSIELRYKGLAGLSDTLASAGASSKTSSSDTAAALAAQANLLTASDVVWEQLYRQPALATLKQQGITGVAIPPSVFVSNPELVSSRAFDVVLSRLSGASTGGAPAGLHGSELIGVHVSPQGADLSTGSATTIQVSQDLTFHVTFKNSGNFPELNVPVTLKIHSGTVNITKTEHQTSIQPSETATVDFSNFELPPDAFANQATVTATVGKVPGETKLDNNSARYPVFFTLSS